MIHYFTTRRALLHPGVDGQQVAQPRRGGRFREEERQEAPSGGQVPVRLRRRNVDRRLHGSVQEPGQRLHQDDHQPINLNAGGRCGFKVGGFTVNL